MNENKKDLIHIGYLFKEKKIYLFLYKLEDDGYQWFVEEDGRLKPAEVKAKSIEKAIFFAYKAFKEQGFQLVHCGYRYELPYRDEHGLNALFFQMAKSYTQPNGVYFDEDLGHLCYVDKASNEALSFLR